MAGYFGSGWVPPSTGAPPLPPWPDGGQEGGRNDGRGRGSPGLGVTVILVGFAVAVGIFVGSTLAFQFLQANYVARDALVVDRPSDEFRDPAGALTVADVLARTAPAVVAIDAPSAGGGGEGSGVILSEDGLVLTNAHVIGGSSRVTVSTPNGGSYDAELVGSYPEEDVALLQIVNPPAGLTPAVLGDSAAMRVGDEVVAIGNTLGLGDTPTVTTGIISGVGRSLDDGESVVLKELLQTDTAINPGNSGGPLVNSSGEVIGINTAIIDGADNVGFAIPVDRIKPLLDNIRNGGGTVRFDQPFLGVVSTGLDNVRAEVLEENDVAATQGVFILEITPRSAAATADLRVNDVIVAIDGETIATPDDVTRIIRSKSVGQTVAVTLDRQGETVEKAVELRARGEAGE